MNMKVQYWHAKRVTIEAGVSGKLPSARRKAERKIRKRCGSALPELENINRMVRATDTLLVFVCVEKGDEKLELNKVVDDILQARILLGVQSIILGAFGHLSVNPAEPRFAKMLSDELIAAVRTRHAQIDSFPFGWDKSLELSVPLHHYNCSFRSFEVPNEDTWDTIAMEFDTHMLLTGHYDVQYRNLSGLTQHIGDGILDIACGSARLLHYIYATKPNLQWTYLGIDSSEEMREIALRNNAVFSIAYAKHFRESVRIRTIPLEDIDCRGNDTIILFNAMSYLDMEVLFTKLHQTKATVIVGEEHPFILGNSANLAPSAKRYLSSIRRVSVAELKTIFINNGFVQIDENETSIDNKHNFVGMVFEAGH